MALALSPGGPAFAVTSGDGDLRASFDGGVSPTTLPRATPSPVALRVAGNVRSASHRAAAVPQLRQITVAINRQSHFFTRGLPVCRASQIQPATEAAARAECGGAIVGSGHALVQLRIPEQPPILIHGRMLAFNGPNRGGHPLILAQVYAKEPPGAFILPFRLSRRSGTFGTMLSATLPRRTSRWAYLTHFDLTLHRIYVYGGRRHSFASAACAAPPGFDTAIFPAARATYRFAGGQRLSMSVTGSCRVGG